MVRTSLFFFNLHKRRLLIRFLSAQGIAYSNNNEKKYEL